ncbi:MAG: hypothetical protein OEY23_19265, partial [Acidimicrobiia bacterium]|nr:hypothetical protein [Acidimicrobiia bacterium]
MSTRCSDSTRRTAARWLALRCRRAAAARASADFERVGADEDERDRVPPAARPDDALADEERPEESRPDGARPDEVRDR